MAGPGHLWSQDLLDLGRAELAEHVPGGDHLGLEGVAERLRGGVDELRLAGEDEELPAEGGHVRLQRGVGGGQELGEVLGDAEVEQVSLRDRALLAVAPGSGGVDRSGHLAPLGGVELEGEPGDLLADAEAAVEDAHPVAVDDGDPRGGAFGPGGEHGRDVGAGGEGDPVGQGRLHLDAEDLAVAERHEHGPPDARRSGADEALDLQLQIVEAAAQDAAGGPVDRFEQPPDALFEPVLPGRLRPLLSGVGVDVEREHTGVVAQVDQPQSCLAVHRHGGGLLFDERYSPQDIPEGGRPGRFRT